MVFHFIITYRSWHPWHLFIFSGGGGWKTCPHTFQCCYFTAAIRHLYWWGISIILQYDSIYGREFQSSVEISKEDIVDILKQRTRFWKSGFRELQVFTSHERCLINFFWNWMLALCQSNDYLNFKSNISSKVLWITYLIIRDLFILPNHHWCLELIKVRWYLTLKVAY